MLHQTKPLNILVTGGSGFLGRHVATELGKAHNVLATYASRKVNILRCKTERMNFLHPSTLSRALSEFEPEAVVHCAAHANAAFCESSPETATAVNATGTEALMKALPSKDVLFIYISTDMVFDGTAAPYREDDETHPLSHYGKTKRRGEQAVQKYWNNHIILRPALMYGKAVSSTHGSFLQWLEGQFQGDGPVKLFSDEYRTPVYVMDVVMAVRKLIQTRGRHRIYHVGGPERTTRVEFGRRFAEFRGYDPGLIEEVPLDAMDTGYARPKDISLDSGRIMESHKLTPTPLEEALGKIYGSAQPGEASHESR